MFLKIIDLVQSTYHDSIDLEIHVVLDLSSQLSNKKQPILAHHVYVVFVVFLHIQRTIGLILKNSFYKWCD